jgi:SAM-dependent methyltransferase
MSNDTRAGDQGELRRTASDSYPEAAESRREFEASAYHEFYGQPGRLERSFFYHNLRTEPAFVRALARKFGLRPGMSLVDIGCGNGLYAHLFREAGLSVTGVDLSDRAIAHCLKMYGDACKWICGDALAMSFGGSFDVAFCHFLTYFNAFDDLRQARGDAARLLAYVKPGGRLFFVWISDLTAVRLTGATRFGIMNYTPRQLTALFEGHPVETFAVDSRARLCRLFGTLSLNKLVTRATLATVQFRSSSWQRARIVLVVRR